jgi:hypothetical protein
MITVASVDFCERCKCRTLHVPLPTGERACENHPPGPELAPSRFVEVTCERCGKTLSELGVNLGQAEAHYRACRGAAPELAPSSPPAARCPLCRMVSPGGTLHHVGCGVGAPRPVLGPSRFQGEPPFDQHPNPAASRRAPR